MGRIALSCLAPSFHKTCLTNGSKVRGCLSYRKTRTVNTKRTFWPPDGCELETTGQYDEDHEAAKLRRPYSFQRASRSASPSEKKSEATSDDVRAHRDARSPGRA